jgi:hypothetical protein
VPPEVLDKNRKMGQGPGSAAAAAAAGKTGEAAASRAINTIDGKEDSDMIDPLEARGESRVLFVCPVLTMNRCLLELQPRSIGFGRTSDAV